MHCIVIMWAENISFLWRLVVSTILCIYFTPILKCPQRTTQGVTGNKVWNVGNMFKYADASLQLHNSFWAVRHFWKSHWSGRRGWNQTRTSLTIHMPVREAGWVSAFQYYQKCNLEIFYNLYCLRLILVSHLFILISQLQINSSCFGV